MAKTLTRTSITVTINGNDYSKYVQFPFKVSNLLDEQLDEASLTLIGVPEKNFKPLTDVTVTLTNVPETQIYHMLVASDKADEIPTGSGKYKHELYLIEQTKYLECFIVRSIGYLNPLEKSYATIESIPYFNVIRTVDGVEAVGPKKEDISFTATTPIYINKEIKFPSISTIVNDIAFSWSYYENLGCYIEVRENGVEVRKITDAMQELNYITTLSCTLQVKYHIEIKDGPDAYGTTVRYNGEIIYSIAVL